MHTATHVPPSRPTDRHPPLPAFPFFPLRTYILAPQYYSWHINIAMRTHSPHAHTHAHRCHWLSHRKTKPMYRTGGVSGGDGGCSDGGSGEWVGMEDTTPPLPLTPPSLPSQGSGLSGGTNIHKKRFFSLSHRNEKTHIRPLLSFLFQDTPHPIAPRRPARPPK